MINPNATPEEQRAVLTIAFSALITLGYSMNGRSYVGAEVVKDAEKIVDALMKKINQPKSKNA